MRKFQELLLASAGLAVLASVPSTALAQSASFNLPAQPARTSIPAFGEQARVQILLSESVAGEQVTSPVQGVLDVHDALRKLLAGTNLRVVSESGGVIVLGRASQPAAAPAARLQPAALATQAPPVSQMAAPPESAEPQELEAIVVTGSRVQRAGFTAPSPTTVMGSDALEQRAAGSLGDVLNDLPAFAPIASATTSGIRPFAPGANYANLRSLGPTRTLVLVNGRRFAPSVPTFGTVGANQVDLNLIPPIMLERAEIVTGGASAQYGSDAVAGVLNLILNTRFEGVKAEATRSISERGDNEESRAAVLFGQSFLEDRARVVVGAEYYNNPGIGDVYTRDWGRREAQLVTNPTPGANGVAASLITENVRHSSSTPGGLINAGPLRGVNFGPNGTTSQYPFGDFVGPIYMEGGGVYGNNATRTVLLAPSVERYSLYAYGDYAVTDTIKGFAEVSYGANASDAIGQVSRDTALNMSVDNPYLPADVRARLLAAGQPTFRLGRFHLDIGGARVRVENENIRAAGGFEGRVAGWRWDAYYQYGKNTYDQVQSGQRINDNFNRAIDAVRNPAGQIVCRSTLTNPTNGCQPFNLFGENAASPEAFAYVTGNSVNRTVYTQQVAAANVNGEPFSVWAGPVSIAAGVEYRREEQDSTTDPISAADRFNVQNPKALTGKFDIVEGYVETVAPIVVDQPWAKRIELNAAIRYADYSTVGGVTTWKLGGTYEINDSVRLRATRSRDIRAPNLFELFASPSPTNPTVTDPFTNTQVAVRQVLAGDSTLREETAQTLSAGVVFTPTFVPRLQVSLDYYRISLEDAILSLQGAATLSLCRATNDPVFCGRIIRNPAGVVTEVRSPFTNVGVLKVEGLDVEVAYSLPLWDGTLSFRGLGTYVFESSTDNGFGPVDRVGEMGLGNLASVPGPQFRGGMTVSYEKGPLSGFAQINYVHEGLYDAALVEGVDIQDNSIPSRTYVNTGVTYAFGGAGKTEVFLNVNNLFDVDPPFVPSTNFNQVTNAAYYDVVGRQFKVGARVRF